MIYQIFLSLPVNNSSNPINHILYADDLLIYIQTTRDELPQNITHFEAAARAVSAWTVGSGLRLNVAKTKTIIFASEYNINYCNELHLPSIEVGDGVRVPFVDTVTSLGVVMDGKLTWKPHVEHVSKRVNRALYSLKTFRSCTTEALRKQLANALVIPHLHYCSIVYLDVNKELQLKLQRLQNACVRYICGARRDEHITPHIRRLGWMKVEERRRYFSTLLLYKIIRMGNNHLTSLIFLKRMRIGRLRWVQ